MWVTGTRGGSARRRCFESGVHAALRSFAWSLPLALGVMLPLVLGPTDSAAQSREVLLGTIQSGNPVSIRHREWAAAGLLADGISALERGDVMLGRRRLEVLVEQYPDAAAAIAARNELGALYSSQHAEGLLVVRDGAAVRRGDVAEGPQPAVEPRALMARPDASREAAREQALVHKRQVEADRRLQGLAYELQSSAGDRVFFAEASAELGAKARAVLAAQARWLLRHPELPVTIEAHADDYRGHRELDVSLSERRGDAVRERLLEEGISPDRITVQSFGRDRPVATCGAPECAVQNRRVVTRIGTVAAPDNVAGRGRESPALATAPRGGSRIRSD